MKKPALILAAFGFGLPLGIQAWNPPDTLELLAEFQAKKRQGGYPVELIRKQGKAPDSQSLSLTWEKSRLVQCRYEQKEPFDQYRFEALADRYGGGGTWHALPDPADGGVERKTFPGLMQQWWLEGYGNVHAWSGTGVHRGRFFLVFRQDAPVPPDQPKEAMALRKDGDICQDTVPGWLQAKCPVDWGGLAAHSRCYSAADNPRRWVAIAPQDQKNPRLAWAAWWQDGDPLQDVANAMKNLPPGAEPEYARELSQVFHGEALVFLAQLAQNNPCLFTHPSWSISRLKEGHVPPDAYQPFLGKRGKIPAWFPAMRLATPQCSLAVDIALGGSYRLQAQTRP